MAHSQLSLCPRRNATSVCRSATLAEERSKLSQHRCHGADVCFSHPAPYGAHHCSSCFQRLGVSCSGTEVLDTRWFVSYLSETSRLRVSRLVSSFSRRSPRCSRVMVLSWEVGEAPKRGCYQPALQEGTLVLTTWSSGLTRGAGTQIEFRVTGTQISAANVTKCAHQAHCGLFC